MCAPIPVRVGSVDSSSSGSLSSLISGTVGRERPAEIGAWVMGVFCGVGAVMFEPEIGTRDDIVAGDEKCIDGGR